MSVYIVTFALALGLTVVITPVVIRFAHARNLLDRPGLRKTHRSSVPRLGGVAIALGVTITLACLAVKTSSITWSVRDNWPQWSAFCAAAIVVFALGLIDDLFNLRATKKLLVQIAAASLVCAFGIRLGALRIDERVVLNLGVYSWPMTVLWIVGVTNAMNLIDGLDGIAAGISAMAALLTARLALTGGQPALALVMISVTGALLGFLIFNFHPARIFLGDCGAMALGFLLATASVRSAAVTGRLTDITLPALALVLPILDTLHCMFRRRAERRSMFSPDRGHIHHRLMAIGLTQRGVSIVLYAVTAMACGLGLLMLVSHGVGSIIIFICVLLLVIQLLKSIGALPLQENVIAMQRSRVIAQRATQDRRAFEQSRLRFEDVHSFDEWWTALCAAAADMNLARIVLWLPGASGTAGHREWRAENVSLSDRLRTTLLLRTMTDVRPAMLEVEASVDGAFESAGCRMQFFARLIDENNPAMLSHRQDQGCSKGINAAGASSRQGAKTEQEAIVFSGGLESHGEEAVPVGARVTTGMNE